MIEIFVEPTEVAIAVLSKEKIDHAANVMAGAFATDPLGSYLLPDARNRLDVMRWFWCEALRHSHPHGRTYTTAPEILGIASWLPPGVRRKMFWGLWLSILQTLYRVGWRSTHRLFALLEFTEMLRVRHCPSPHWYLDGLAVTPESQGRGIGSLLLQPVLDLADEEEQACCLYTSTERAVRFYQRQGFVVCEEARFQTEAPPLWLMVRSPKDLN
ncbi:GCN5-related N-acetyltransferase [Rippkaea orientalis PCC 8801]|uniref:GCN5-related N-acetyltransferase n=1 Tax=Rippkaea orientalis (strain PCC 8801 / RF-1) TaxID=41431 RepID=B7JYN8_RIPO1|nr:GNAT family N-acetyltransferase [Rippkaea orientalis]ACK64908.1 GCN5-related N-acetyltransferase [Rippkaea orientalis PCC 8801]